MVYNNVRQNNVNYLETKKLSPRQLQIRINLNYRPLSRLSMDLKVIKGQDMILSDFLSRQKHDDSNPYEIIPITSNIHSILQMRYYNLGKENPVKYLVQTWSQAKASGIKLPEVHGIGKGLDPNVQPEKQGIMPIAVTKTKEESQIIPRLGQGRAG